MHQERWSAELRAHHEQMRMLAERLAAVQVPGWEADEHAKQQVVYLRAQMVKHEIEIALLSSRLGDDPRAAPKA